jgi:2-O-(6-phospho-alpha-D-mannosyl)-D-glycerate hydrolase
MRPTYHIVSHSHWDREWYKSFEQFRSMLVNMVDDLLDLLERDPRYTCFTLDGQAVILDDYLAVRPENEQRIRALVESGRLLSGPWYILPDEFLVCGEATIRNLQFGIRTAGQFGRPMMVGYIPDSFGHIAMMPAILHGFGIDVALVYRGFGGEPGQKTSEYWWTAPDGSRALLVHLYRHGYSGGYFHQETDGQILQRFAGLKNELDERATTSQRLLMNGGDHHWPDPRLPDTIELLREHFDAEFVHSTVPRYVEAIKQEVNGLPEVSGEFRFGYRYAFAVLSGVYSSRMYLKQRNWHIQNLLQRYVEPLNAIATLKGMRPQMPLVRQAWKTLLMNHPHDSICGCSIDPVHREMMTRFTAVEDIGNTVMETALHQLIPYDDRATGDDRFIYLFNPSPFARSEITAVRVNFYLQDVVVGLNPDVVVDPKLPPVTGFTLRDADGAEAPCQILDRREGYDITYTKYNYPKQTYADQFTLLIDAKNVPPLGFKGFRIEKTKRLPRFDSILRSGRNFIENRFLRVEITAKGELKIKDKARGATFSGLNVFEDSGDVGDEYNYSYPRKDTRVSSTKSPWRVRLVEKGPLRVTLEMTGSMAVPVSATHDQKARSTEKVRLPITSRISLTPYARSLNIETTVDNRAKDHRLRALFRSGIQTDRVVADAQFCVVEREQKKYDVRKFTIEHPAMVAPMQRFVTVRNKTKGLTLLTYGLPEYELKLDGKGTIALTLLRCVGTLAGEHLITRPGGKGGWHNETPDAQCQGVHTFLYALFPHGGDGTDWLDQVNEEAERFHLSLLPLRRKNPGDLPMQDSYLSLSPEGLVFSACKISEDGKDLIVRVYNPTRDLLSGAIDCSGLGVREAHRARLDETVLSPLEVRDGSVQFDAPPSSLVTVRLRCEANP